MGVETTGLPNSRKNCPASLGSSTDLAPAGTSGKLVSHSGGFGPAPHLPSKALALEAPITVLDGQSADAQISPLPPQRSRRQDPGKLGAMATTMRPNL